MRRLRLVNLWLACVSCFLAASVAEAQFPQRPYLVRDLNLAGGSDPQSLTALGETLYFTANAGPFGAGLWKSDGTFQGTTLVSSFLPGPSVPTELTAWGGALYFAAADFANGVELWRSDGTGPGTSVVFEINPFGSASPRHLTPSGRYLYFTADDGIRGAELWRTDGTPEGTTMVRDISFAPPGSQPRELTDFNGVLLFVATGDFGGEELWRTDGTEQGTFIVADIRPGPDGSGINEITVVGGHAYFSADDGVNGTELWVTDGTPSPFGTRIDIRPGPASSSPSGLTVVRGALVFAADDGVFGRELWHLGPFPDFLQLLADIVPGPDGSNPTMLRHSEGRLFFVADDGLSGAEPWVSDARPFFGTTSLVSDLRFGPESSSPQHLTDVNGTLMFQADNGPFQDGAELWSASPGGFGLNEIFVLDVHPGPFSAHPAEITLAGGRLFFTADDGIHGRELWTVDNQPPVAAAGPDQTIEPGGVALFGAHESTDPDPFFSRSFEWRDPDGLVIGRDVVVDVPVTEPGVREYTLIVRDGFGGRSEDTVTVSTPGRTAPVVTITSPTPGEVLTVGSPAEIRWTATDESAIVATKVLLSVDGGITYAPIAGCDVPGPATSCTWTPPTVLDQGFLRVEATDDMGDRGTRTVVVEVAPPPTGPQRLEITVDGVDGSLGTVITFFGQQCFNFPGQPQVTCTFLHDPGTQVQLFAQPQPPSSFAGWSGHCSGSGDCTVTMNGTRRVTATFRPPPPVTLTLTVDSLDNGVGGVHVFGSDGTFNPCEAVPDTTQTCTFVYTQGTFVDLFPNPAPDTTFVGFAGACTGTDPCRLTLEQPVEVAATFRGPQFVDLTVTVESVDDGVGRIGVFGGPGQPVDTCEGTPGSSQTCTFRYRQGSFVGLVQSPALDSEFVSWGGACEGNGPDCQVVLDEPRQVTARFRGPQTLTVAVESVDNGLGRVELLTEDGVPGTCEGTAGSTQTCTFQYRPGTNVSLFPNWAPDSVFMGWSGACTGNGPCNVTMSQARQVTARFRGPQTLTVHVNSLNGGSGRVQINSGPENCENSSGTSNACTFAIPADTAVALTAMPHPESVFAGWGGACSGTGPCVVTMSGPATVSVLFERPNRPPVAHAGGPYAAVRNQPITFDGSASSDPDGDALTYLWDFGDGTTGIGVAPTHAYSSLGVFTVRLTVSDGQATSEALVSATITNARPLANAGPDRTVRRRTVVLLDGRASSDPDGTITAYQWRQVSGAAVQLVGDRFPVAAFVAPNVQNTVTLEFELTVTDNDGGVATDRVRITVTR